MKKKNPIRTTQPKRGAFIKAIKAGTKKLSTPTKVKKHGR